MIYMEKSVDPFSESVWLYRSRYITLWSGMGLIYMEKSVDPSANQFGFTGLDI